MHQKLIVTLMSLTVNKTIWSMSSEFVKKFFPLTYLTENKFLCDKCSLYYYLNTRVTPDNPDRQKVNK